MTLRYKLRTLMVALALGPPLLWGAVLWCRAAASVEETAFRAAILPLAIATSAFVFCLHWLADTELARRFRGRQNLSDAELSSAFRASVTSSSAIAHLRLIGEALNVDYGKLRPSDLLTDLVRPYWTAEHFHGEAFEELLTNRLGWSRQELVPDTLGVLLTRLDDLSPNQLPPF